MGLIAYLYKKKFVHRYDKEVGIPYYSYLDFVSLKQDKSTFINSRGVSIHYFFYYYEGYKKKTTILFCPGIGPGHTAYMKEIMLLAKEGYRVLTLDYTGCGESKGKYLGSLSYPTYDAIELLKHLNINEDVVLVGHSLGGFTALNVIHKLDFIHKAIIISGFLDIPSLNKVFIKSNYVLTRTLKYEKKVARDIFTLNNIDYLNKTNDDLLFIHSIDDNVVPYDISLKVVEGISNPHIKTLKVDKKRHNPNYKVQAIDYMSEVFSKYNSLIKDKKIKSDEDKIAYFKNVSLDKLTEQDEKVISIICNFI